MEINKEKFNDLWNDVFSRRQLVPPNTGEMYYLSGCLDIMRKIKEQVEIREDDNPTI